ncbi:MAG TPA: GNAT family N-acetyltransferase [Casimicrobiaceae bacterium]|nr:GNAT family N-acetyltransferase [Casimicrobiaceae bacterium]
MRALRTPLCDLEPQVAAHAHEMFVVLGDPAIYEFENAPPESEAWLAERYARLESRCSVDGTERWLNWVVRLRTGELCGYVQATVLPSGEAYVAYELASRHWRRGLGSCAVRAVLAELASGYAVHTYLAVLKTCNFRSLAMLRHLGFTEAPEARVGASSIEPDELLMHLRAPGSRNVA